MVNSKNLKNPKVITTQIESEEYKRLRKNLGNRPFTDWLREQMKQYNEGLEIEKKNVNALHEKGAIRMSANYINTTLDKYIPDWIKDYKNHKRMNEIQDNLSYEDQLLLVTATNHVHKIFKGRLPRKVVQF